MHRILVLHGPNLDALGTREPEVYGTTTLAEIDRRLQALATELDCRVECRQSNHEGVLIDAIYASQPDVHGIVVNPGGLGHTSVALRDALAAVGRPSVEVHLTNPATRESFRHTAPLSSAVLAVVQGFGPDSYLLALRGLAAHLAGSAARG
jgi:3-dehydroquinate dehydratase II